MTRLVMALSLTAVSLIAGYLVGWRVATRYGTPPQPEEQPQPMDPRLVSWSIDRVKVEPMHSDPWTGGPWTSGDFPAGWRCSYGHYHTGGDVCLMSISGGVQ